MRWSECEVRWSECEVRWSECEVRWMNVSGYIRRLPCHRFHCHSAIVK